MSNPIQMSYYISYLTKVNPKRRKDNRRFDTFDDAWDAAKIIADQNVDSGEGIEIRFEKAAD